MTSTSHTATVLLPYSDSCYDVAKMTGRIHAFRNNRELQRFVLSDVRIKGRKLGVGSYGSVEELEVNGLVCAGKRLHEALVEHENVGVDTIVRKYLQECQVTSSVSGMLYIYVTSHEFKLARRSLGRAGW